MIKSTKKAQIQRNWHLIDAKGQVVGRLATQIVPLLMGKNKPYFVRNMDVGDYVVVINAKEVVFTGRKESRKTYTRYSGYPGGLKKETAAQMREKHPERIMERAVSNMLPKNKLRADQMARLHVYAETAHPYAEKFVKKEGVVGHGKTKKESK